MSDYDADSPPPCPRCGAQLRNRAWPEPGIRRQGCMTDGCYCEIESPLASPLTVATAPWSRDLWAEVERVTAERDAAAAKERAAVVAWLRLFSPRDSWDGYVPTEVAAAIEAGDHLEATRG